MKGIFLIILLYAFRVDGFAQQFQEKLRVALPDSITKINLEWVDLDNDSLLDVLVGGTDPSGKQLFLTYKNDKGINLIFKTTVITDFVNNSVGLYDINLDNRTDIIISGTESGLPATTAFISNGNFTFTKLNSPIAALAGIFRLADLDQNATMELLISGSSGGKLFTKVLANTGGTWQVKKDTLTVFHTWTDAAHVKHVDSMAMYSTSMHVFDFDRDGDNDLFATAYYKGDSIFNGVLYNLGNFKFSAVSTGTSLIDASITAGDLNSDGLFDVILTGDDKNGNAAAYKLINTGSSFQKSNFSSPVKDSNVLVADLDDDGVAEISFTGIGAATDTVNLVINNQGSSSLPVHGYITQKFGDVDRDGDLDLAQVIYDQGSRVVVYQNTIAQKNVAPIKPGYAFAARVFNRVLMYWATSTDDHTPEFSLTYDLTLLSSQTDIMLGDFDEINQRRLLVRNGNQSANNYNIFRDLPDGNLHYVIQGIDNTFHAGNKGICTGTSVNCSVQAQPVAACKDEELQFASPDNLVWFSFAKGYLNTGTSLDVKALVNDTLISFPKVGASCQTIKLYTIDLKENYDKVTNTTRYVCEGSSVPFSVETNWPHVEWSSTVKNFISNAYTINYPFTASNDTVKVKINTGTMCNIQRNTTLKLSKPVITVAPSYQILKGESVQLNASGGQSYQWSPANSLDNAAIANPTATPAVTTEYTVESEDSIGCTVSAKVLVVVEQTAFIPSLFTPNGDGKNDQLRIYGLASPKSFTFTIHNREGNLIYQSNSFIEVVNDGWDGTANGSVQPGGVYYWKLKGETSAGKRLLLNGKTQGSIVLIR